MAWYQGSRIDNFAFYPDPVGNYAKPDSNISAAAGTPITALAAGTVTSVRLQPWAPAAWSITVRMDQPYNSVATHTAYNYVSDPQVTVGQHVDFGTVLAVAGNPYDVGTAFAFCDSDVYGTATKNEPFSGPYINPLLNPVPFLDELIATGKPPTSGPAAGNTLEAVAEAVLKEVGVPQAGIDALKLASPQALDWIGGAIIVVGLAAAAGILFLFTGV